MIIAITLATDAREKIAPRCAILNEIGSGIMEGGANMQEIKVTIDGKEQTLTAEQVKNISKMFPRNEWVRKDKYEIFWFVDALGDTLNTIDCLNEYGSAYYDFGNYYPTEHIAEMRSLDWQLNNLLFRYSMQHGGEADGNRVESFVLMWDEYCHCFGIAEAEENRFLTSVVFHSRIIAEAAINEVARPFCKSHPEYLDWLRGDKR